MTFRIFFKKNRIEKAKNITHFLQENKTGVIYLKFPFQQANIKQ